MEDEGMSEPDGGQPVKVYVVMDQLAMDDDGDSDVDLAAVHLTRQGAEGNLTPDGTCGRKGPGQRERYIAEMEVLP